MNKMELKLIVWNEFFYEEWRNELKNISNQNELLNSMKKIQNQQKLISESTEEFMKQKWIVNINFSSAYKIISKK